MGNQPDTKKISVCAICYNEEVDLPGFLSNVLPWAHEVILVDDGSEDNTQAIAAAAGEKVRFYSHPMGAKKDFGAQRNYALSRATGDWVLHMDIDERVTPELYASMQAAVLSDQKNAYRYHRLNFFLNQEFKAGGWQNWNKPQFARRGRHHFVNEIHEQCEVEGGPNAIGQLEGEMWHLVDKNYRERISKNILYAEMVSRRILKRGIKVRWYHILFHPLMRALKAYFLQGAIWKGTKGLIFGLYTFTGTFNWWVFAWEQQNGMSREKVEQKLQRKWERAQNG